MSSIIIYDTFEVVRKNSTTTALRYIPESIRDNKIYLQILNNGDEVVYPNEYIHISNDIKYIFIQCINEDRRYIIRYLNIDYIMKYNDNYKLKEDCKSKTLRFLVDSKDPNKYPMIDGKKHKSYTINQSDIFRFPKGELEKDLITTQNNKYVIVHKKDDPNIIGYINTNYLKLKY